MAIDLAGISKSYGEHRALEPIDLHVEEGEFVTLLGPSGCGKSTLLRILAGFVTPTEGRVLLDGVDITDVPENRREVGLLFQSYALFPHMTVADNVRFGLKMRKIGRLAAADRVDMMLHLVSMEGFADRYPKQLSGGQQQRVALARVLAIQPKVLLLDEPLAALDRMLRVQMQVELSRLVAEVGITTVFVTHDQDEALAMSDRIAVMDRGRVVQYDTPRNIYDYPDTEFVANFVGTSNIIVGSVVAEPSPHFAFDGEVIPLNHAAAVTAGPAKLLIRPEHLMIGPAHGSESGPFLTGWITMVRPVGESVLYDVVLRNGTSLVIKTTRLRSWETLKAADEVRVSLGTDDAAWVLGAQRPQLVSL